MDRSELCRIRNQLLRDIYNETFNGKSKRVKRDIFSGSEEANYLYLVDKGLVSAVIALEKYEFRITAKGIDVVELNGDVCDIREYI